MTVGMISKRYAKALLGYAQEQKNDEVVYLETKSLAAAFAQEPRLRMAMDNPIVTAKEKLELLKAAVGNNCSPTLIRFFELVLKNSREQFLQFIALSYGELYREANHINQGRLVTAAPADKASIEKLKAVLQKIKPGQQEIETLVDPSIDGGFVLFVDTYRLDASVASQLKRIKKQFAVENSKVE